MELEARLLSESKYRALFDDMPVGLIEASPGGHILIANRAWRRDEAVAVAIDILDEDHSLRLAMRRLASDASLRAELGAAGRRYWEDEHSMPRMVEDYRRVLATAVSRPAPEVARPAHLVTNGDQVLRRVLEECALPLELGFRPA